MQENKKQPEREPFTEQGGRSVPEHDIPDRVDNAFGKSNDRKKAGSGGEAKRITDRRGTGTVESVDDE